MIVSLEGGARGSPVLLGFVRAPGLVIKLMRAVPALALRAALQRPVRGTLRRLVGLRRARQRRGPRWLVQNVADGLQVARELRGGHPTDREQRLMPTHGALQYRR